VPRADETTIGNDETLSGSAEAEAAPTQLPDESLPLVGRQTYRVVGEIAQGGGGRILRAFDQRLGRWVALKLPIEKEGYAERRFRNEARVTARLEHPGIVPVHEVGRWPTGELFYAMKLVSGRSLADVLAKTRSLDDRLPLLPHLIAVSEAMAYAHSQHVIHRDLKPSNIMLGPFGEALVIDWGLAKDLQQQSGPADSLGGSLPSSPEETSADAVLGTPAYMAPEQAETPAVDARADVYALGAVLYALFTGRAPYLGRDGQEVLERVKLGAPERVRLLEPGVPEELAAIIEKAMRRNPAERYADAAELAAELRRFETGQLVRAHHYSRSVLVRRWLKRNRRLVAIAAAALVAVMATVTVSFQRVVRARNDAEARRDQLVLAQARSSLAKDPTLAVAWAKSYGGRRGADSAALAAIAAEARSLGVARYSFKSCARAVLAPDGATMACLDHGRIRVWRGKWSRLHSPDIETIRYLSDGTLVSAGRDGAVRRWDGAVSQVLMQLGEPAFALMIAGDTVAASGTNGAVLVRLPSGRTWAPPELHPGDQVFLDLSPDGRYLSTLAVSGRAHIWKIGEPDGYTIPDPPKMKSIAFSPGSDRAAWGSLDGGVRIVDLATHSLRILRGHQYPMARVAFSPDGKTLVSACQDKTERLWNLATGEWRALSQSDIAWRVFFSPDGSHLLLATEEDIEQRLIDLRTFDVTVLRGHVNQLERIQFSSDGRTLLTSATDGETRLWPVAQSPERVLRGHSSAYASVALRRDGKLVSAAPDSVRTWDLEHDTVEALPSPMPQGCFFDLNLHGESLAYFCPHLTLLDLSTRKATRFSDEEVVAASSLRFGRILFGLPDGTLKLLDVSSGSQRVLAHLPMAAMGMTGTPDGNHWAVATDNGTVRILDEAGVRHELVGHMSRIRDLAFDDQGRRLATASVDPVVRIWDVQTGKGRELIGHSGSVERLRFSPAGDILASSSGDKTIRLWHLDTGESRVLPVGSFPGWMAFSADGRLLFGGGVDGVVREWDVDSGVLMRVWRGHEGEIQTLEAPAGAPFVVSYADDQSLRLWPLADAQRAPSLAELTTAELSGDERPVTPE
jgi:WD40 repeat protein